MKIITLRTRAFFRLAGRSLRHTSQDMLSSDIQILASSLAFATVISIVPLLAVSLSVFQFYGGFESLIKRIEPLLLQHLVTGSGGDVSRAIQLAITRVHSGTLGFGGAVGLLFASTKLFHDMETAVHRIWKSKPQRSIFIRVLVYWGIMFIGPLALAAAVGLWSSKDLGLTNVFPRSTFGFGLSFVALFCIYKFVPSRKVDFRWAFWSSLFAGVCMLAAQETYASITRHILRYNKVYGSLASIPIFLLWILVLWWICLIGVALCASLQKHADERERLCYSGSVFFCWLYP